MEVTPPPRTYPLQWIGLEKIVDNSGVPLLPREAQHHQVFDQPLNVEPQWACICMRHAHNKQNGDL